MGQEVHENHVPEKKNLILAKWPFQAQFLLENDVSS